MCNLFGGEISQAAPIQLAGRSGVHANKQETSMRLVLHSAMAASPDQTHVQIQAGNPNVSNTQ